MARGLLSNEFSEVSTDMLGLNIALGEGLSESRELQQVTAHGEEG